MRKKYIVLNATFKPDRCDKIIYDIPAMCCAKNLNGCPIEKNPILDDYILMGNKEKLENTPLNSDYCIFIANQLADSKIVAPIELEYSACTNIFKCSHGAHMVCVAQKLNTVNVIQCGLKVNLIVNP